MKVIKQAFRRFNKIYMKLSQVYDPVYHTDIINANILPSKFSFQ